MTWREHWYRVTWSFDSWGQANTHFSKEGHRWAHSFKRKKWRLYLPDIKLYPGKHNAKSTNGSQRIASYQGWCCGQKPQLSCNLRCINREITRRKEVVSHLELLLVAEIACLVLTCWEKPEKAHENHWPIRKPLSAKCITKGQSIYFTEERAKELQDQKIHVMAIGNKKGSNSFFSEPGQTIRSWSYKILKEMKKPKQNNQTKKHTNNQKPPSVF